MLYETGRNGWRQWLCGVAGGGVLDGVLCLDAGGPGGRSDADHEAVLLAVGEGGGLLGVAGGVGGVVHEDGGVGG